MIVNYDPKYRDQLNLLVSEFFKKSLNDYGLVMEETIKQFEQNLEIFLKLDGDKVIGVIAGHLSKQIMSSKMIFQEVIWYVDENHRGCGIQLLHHLESWCKERGVDQIIMARMHNSMPHTLGQFYERMGYSPLETHYIKDVEREENGEISQANS